MRLARLFFLCLAVCTAPAVAAAQPRPGPAGEPGPARRYARGSFALTTSSSMNLGFFDAPNVGSGFTGGALGGNVMARLVLRPGLLVQARGGVDALFMSGAAGLYLAMAARIGLGVGWALPLSDRVALSPSVGYDLTLVAGGINSNLTGLAHAVTAEVPLTIFVTRGGFIEPFVMGGAALAFGGVAPVVGVGHRFGLVF
jgi:hypothetical protein